MFFSIQNAAMSFIILPAERYISIKIELACPMYTQQLQFAIAYHHTIRWSFKKGEPRSLVYESQAPNVDFPYAMVFFRQIHRQWQVKASKSLKFGSCLASAWIKKFHSWKIFRRKFAYAKPRREEEEDKEVTKTATNVPSCCDYILNGLLCGVVFFLVVISFHCENNPPNESNAVHLISIRLDMPCLVKWHLLYGTYTQTEPNQHNTQNIEYIHTAAHSFCFDNDFWIWSMIYIYMYNIGRAFEMIVNFWLKRCVSNSSKSNNKNSNSNNNKALIISKTV